MTLPLLPISCQPRGRAASLAEAVVNVIAGFVLSIIVQLGAYPLLDITTTATQNGLVALLFTAVSVLRSYLVRRLFVAIEANRECERRRRAQSLERRLATGRL